MKHQNCIKLNMVKSADNNISDLSFVRAKSPTSLAH